MRNSEKTENTDPVNIWSGVEKSTIQEKHASWSNEVCRIARSTCSQKEKENGKKGNKKYENQKKRAEETNER